MTTQQTNEAQQLFDETYITGFEICQQLGIPRSTLLRARERAALPEPVLVPGVKAFIWERSKVAAAIEAWKESLQARRGA